MAVEQQRCVHGYPTACDLCADVLYPARPVPAPLAPVRREIIVPLRCQCGNRDDTTITAPPCSAECGRWMELGALPAPAGATSPSAYEFCARDCYRCLPHAEIDVCTCGAVARNRNRAAVPSAGAGERERTLEDATRLVESFKERGILDRGTAADLADGIRALAASPRPAGAGERERVEEREAIRRAE